MGTPVAMTHRIATMDAPVAMGHGLLCHVERNARTEAKITQLSRAANCVESDVTDDAAEAAAPDCHDRCRPAWRIQRDGIPETCGALPKCSIRSSVRIRTLRAGCCPGGRTTKMPNTGGG